MNNTTYWIVGVTGAIVLLLLSWFLWPSPSQQAPNNTIGGGYPQDVPYGPYSTEPSTGSGDSSTVSILAQNGQVFVVRDFLNNGETAKDVVNPGYFILAGDAGYCLANGTCVKGAASDEFFISFNQKTGFFNISLLKEPIAQARANAEKFIMSRLAIGRVQLCSLEYFVSVSSSVNPIYAGKNLGFSFCPGATEL